MARMRQKERLAMLDVKPIKFGVVSECALIQRIKRKLAHEGDRFCVYRGGRWESDLGRYYVVNASNWLTARDIDLEAFAREIGVMHEAETLAPE